jgi:hypothetical protein
MNRVIVGPCGNDRLLATRQKLLCLGPRQPQISDIRKASRPSDLYQIDAPRPAVRPHFDQP